MAKIIFSIILLLSLDMLLEISAKQMPTGHKKMSKEEVKRRWEKQRKENKPKPHIKAKMKPNKHRAFTPLNTGTVLPDSFDWRDHTDCLSVKEIRTQTCGNCWAVSTTDAFSDRYCLFSEQQVYFSMAHTTSCAGINGPNAFCQGSNPDDSNAMFVNSGVAFGGDYMVGSEQQCSDGTLVTFGQTQDQQCLGNLGAFWNSSNANNQKQCPQACDDGSALQVTKAYSNVFNDFQMLQQQNPSYTLDNMINDTKWEIFQHGPIVGAMNVDNVFANSCYDNSEDVYRVNPAAIEGGHAIRMIGWGTTEQGTPYWLIANQYGAQWGRNGTARIFQGDPVNGLDGQQFWVYPTQAYTQ